MRLLAGWVVAIVKWKTYATEPRCVPTAHAIRIVFTAYLLFGSISAQPRSRPGEFPEAYSRTNHGGVIDDICD